MTSENLSSLRLAVDTASLVLIWLVELVIYPAFLHFPLQEFRTWHLIYTKRVVFVVVPVLLAQLTVYICLAVVNPAAWDIWLNIGLMVMVWLVTFILAMPLHNSLDVVESHTVTARRLIKVNIYRTFLWTAMWIITFIMHWI